MGQRRPLVLGLVVLALVGGVIALFRLWPHTPSLRYVADGAPFAVTISLRPTTPTAVVPESVTVELPSGERLTAHRLR